MTLTEGTPATRRTACMTLSWSAPPPTSRKLAAFPAIELDQVERGHRKPCTVTDYTDGAIEFYVTETMVRGNTFTLGKRSRLKP